MVEASSLFIFQFKIFVLEIIKRTVILTLMNITLDRRLNKIQFNVQEEINILDERISYFANYLQNLQSQISDAEDQNNRLNLRLEQIQHLKNGKESQKKAIKGTIISQLRNNHDKMLKELDESHNLRIKMIKEDFENTYEEIDKQIEQKEIEKCKPIEDEIKRTIDLINKLKAQAAQADNQVDNGDEQEIERSNSFDVMRIQSLEAKLKEQNQIRLSSLLDYKKQIQECVHVLEEKESNHYSKMDQLKNQLDNIDANYKEQVKRNTEKQKRETSDLKRNIKDMHEKVKTVSKSLSRAQKKQKDDILKLTQESEYLRVELLTVKKKETQKRESDNDIQNYQNKFSELKSKLKERESILLKVRADNETLKKEIARVSQEKQIAQRRAALHIM